MYKQKGRTAYKISKRDSRFFDSIEIIRKKKKLESLKSLLQKENWQIQKGNSLFRISKFKWYKSYAYYALYDNLQQKRSNVHLYWAVKQKLEKNYITGGLMYLTSPVVLAVDIVTSPIQLGIIVYFISSLADADKRIF